MIFFILIILVLSSSVVVESFMPSTDEMLLTLDCDCHENNKSFMFNFNITSSNEDLDETYIHNNKSNESMNNGRHHTPCKAMQSFISKLCINKSKCLIKLNDFIISNDRCFDGKKLLCIQFLCGRTSSSSLSLPSSASSSQEFTNTKVTYIFTLNTYNTSSVTNKDKDILQYRYNYSESIFFTIDEITDKSTVEPTVAAVITTPPSLLQQASSPNLNKTMQQGHMKKPSDIIPADESTAIASISIEPTSINTKERSAYPSLSFTAAEPSTAPTTVPSVNPSEPSVNPSELPSAPSTVPTAGPLTAPTTVPSSNPSELPSAAPSVIPSSSPCEVPSTVPTAGPSTTPTTVPSVNPSVLPSAEL
jgi:hypothetical protein